MSELGVCYGNAKITQHALKKEEEKKKERKKKKKRRRKEKRKKEKEKKKKSAVSLLESVKWRYVKLSDQLS